MNRDYQNRTVTQSENRSDLNKEGVILSNYKDLDRITDFTFGNFGSSQNEKSIIENTFCSGKGFSNYFIKPNTELAGVVLQMWKALLPKVEPIKDNYKDRRPCFSINWGEHRYRVTVSKTITGWDVTLRWLCPEPGDLDLIMYPKFWKEILTDEYKNGGLIIVAGTAGAGKTTTGTAAVIARLKKYGAHCRAIEEPPEILMQGVWGNGICKQTPVTDEISFEKNLESAIRTNHAIAGNMLYIGEIASEEAAFYALKYASSGLVVIVTVTAINCAQAIDKICEMSDAYSEFKGSTNLMKTAFRGCIHQCLEQISVCARDPLLDRVVEGTCLISNGHSTHPVYKAIDPHNLQKKQSLLQIEELQNKARDNVERKNGTFSDFVNQASQGGMF